MRTFAACAGGRVCRSLGPGSTGKNQSLRQYVSSSIVDRQLSACAFPRPFRRGAPPATVLDNRDTPAAPRVRKDTVAKVEPAVANAISGNAYRPRDVLQTRAGTIVENGNTDAKGRLILCDAIWEAANGSEQTPDVLTDAATLTGAARVALGVELPAVFSSTDDTWRQLEAAAAAEVRPGWVSGGSTGPGKPEGGEALGLRALWAFLRERYSKQPGAAS